MSPNKLFNTDIVVSGSVTTVSGVFQSLTVSGVPVATEAPPPSINTMASGVIARQLDLTHNPVGFWRMDVDLSDSSGNGADVDQNDSYVPGFMSNALRGARRNGQFGYQSTTGHSHLQLQGDMTIQAIVDIQQFPSTFNQSIVAFGVNGGGAESQNWQYNLQIGGTGQLRYRYETGAGSSFDFDSPVGEGFEIGHQYHIAMVRTNNNAQFYIDGRKFGPAQTGGAAPTGGGDGLLYINAFDSGNRDMAMSSIKIIDRALSEQELWEEYERTWPVLRASVLDIDQVTAVSGSFTQSLTISGTPVNIDFSSGFRGALIWTSSGTSCDNNAAQILAWENVAYDTDNFFDPLTDDNRFVVPAGVNKVKVRAQIRYAADAGPDRRVIIRKNDNPQLGQGPEVGQVGFYSSLVTTHESDDSIFLQAFTNPVSVVEGDTFQLHARQGSGGTINTEADQTWFGIEVVDPTAAQNPAEVFAVSGTFTNHLTVSGVPVHLQGAQESQFVGSNVAFIRDVTLDSDTSEITFNDLPQNAANLVVHYSLRADPANENTGLRIRFNNDSSASYDTQQNRLVNGTITLAFQGFGETEGALGAVLGDLAVANNFTVGEILVADYTSTAKNTTYRGTNYAERDGADVAQQEYFIMGGNYNKTDAITSVTIYSPSNNFVSGSKATLYGYTDDVLAATVSHVIAASGTFSDSLTISGTPVALASVNGDFLGSVIYKLRDISDQSVADGAGNEEAITFGTTQYDTGGWSDGDNPTRLTVPSGLGIRYVVLHGQATHGAIGGTDSIRLSVHLNGGSVNPATPFHKTGSPGTFPAHIGVETYPVPVSEGDYFELIFRNESGSAVDVLDDFDNTYFAIHAVQAGGNSQELVVASGIFSDTLTVSGVPVNTGATEIPDPLNITELVAVTGTFTEGLTVGTGSTVITGDIITTATGTFDTLTVSGVPVNTGDLADLRSKNYSGAMVTRESGSAQAISGDTAVTWHDEQFDTDGFFSSGNNTRLTVPAGKGIKKIRLTGMARISPSDTPASGEYPTVQIFKNGTFMSDPRIVFRYNHVLANAVDVSIPFVIPTIPVETGDYFELIVATNVGGSPVISTLRSWFEIEVMERDAPFALGEFTAVSGTFSQSLTVSGTPVVINPLTGKNTHRGAKVSMATADQTVADLTTTQIDYTVTDYDTDGFVVGGDQNEFVIPEGVTRVRMTAQAWWDSDTAGARQISFRDVTSSFPGGGLLGYDTKLSNGGTQQQAVTYVMDVVAGQKFAMAAFQTSGDDRTLEGTTAGVNWMEIVVMEDNQSWTIDELTTVTGTFTQSLTVSGVPVNIGESGGAAPTTISGIIGNKLGLTHSPVALYLFDDNLTDSSGNGLDLSVGAGAERYTNVNGLRSAKFDSTNYFRYTPGSSALEITGDITIQFLLTSEDLVGTSYMLSFAAGGDAESANALYACRAASSTENYSWFSESGAGVDASYGGWNGSGNHTIHHLTYVRESDIVTLYIDGAKRGSSGTLATTTGGTASVLDVGAFDGGSIWRGTIACIKIVNSALTATQVYDEYKTTWATLV